MSTTERNEPLVPDKIQAAVRPGHALEFDPPAALTAVQRWTCTTCGDAALRNGSHIYGGATERTCEQSQRFWAPIGAERCETTDLLVNQCGCPKHRDGRTPQEEAAADLARFADRPGPWFAATRPGECSSCEVPFRAGKQIRADGEGGWQCCS